MVYNRIQVAFGALKKITGPPLQWQYNEKQILVVSGLDLPEYYAVDFMNEGDAETITMPNTENGVEIPDQFLLTGKKLIAYIVVVDGESVNTIGQITFPVNVRGRRTDISPEPAEQQQIDSLIGALNDGVSRAETAASEAETSAGSASADADRAEVAATRAEEAAEDASAYAIRAEDAAGHAESSAQDAAESVETAAEKAEEAAESARASGLSAEESAEQANNAGHYASEASESASSAASSASVASASAGQAASSASAASGSASQAAGSAQSASGSATSASQSATNAANSASTATTKAGEASESATTATNAKNDAVTAKEAAETAQAAAEEAAESIEESASAIAKKAPAIYQSGSGDIVTFDNGAEETQIRKLVGTIVPQQSGTGDSSPTNERPISGWNRCNIYNAVELYDASTNAVGKALQPGGSLVDSSYSFTTAYMLCTGCRKIIIEYDYESLAATGERVIWVFRQASQPTRISHVKYDPTQKHHEIDIPLDANYIRITFDNNVTDIAISGAEIDINWQSEAGTIYGGTVTLNEDGSADVVSGYAIKTEFSRGPIDSSEKLYRIATVGDGVLGGDTSAVDGVLCNKFVNKSLDGARASLDPCIAYFRSSRGSGIYVSGYIGKEDELDELLPTLQVVYPLATPQTYHFNDIGRLYAYFGQNNVWIDTGTITECEYPVDTKSYIDELGTEVDENETAITGITSSLAPVEETSTASRAYAVGDLLMYQSQLYKVASAIAAGGTLTVGTNIVATTVDNELAEIGNELAEVDEEFARVDEEIAHARISPSMALTQHAYIQNGSQTYSSMTVTITNGAIHIESASTASYKNIFITGEFFGAHGGSSTITPPRVTCLDVSLIRGCDAVKSYVSNTLASNPITIIFVNISDDSTTVINRQNIVLETDSGITLHPITIPDNATHYAIEVYRGSGSEIGERDVILEFDRTNAT